MRVALGQLDPLVGGLQRNAEAVRATARESASRGAGLLVLPELVLTGYPPLDLLDQPAFVAAALDARAELVAALGREAPALAVVFGALGRTEGGGKALQNVAVLARGGRELAVRAKSLLPGYDVFDEDRWFAPAAGNAPADLDGLSLGLTICEDIWNDELYWSRRLYARDPVTELADAGMRALVNVSASPYHRGKAAGREEMLRATARRHGVPVVFVNQVGGNDELIFDGGSLVIDGAGRTVHRSPRMREDLSVIELPLASGALPDLGPAPPDSVSDLRAALALGVRDYVTKCGFRSVVLGLSGGIDSAVVAALAVDALGPDRVEGVLMPSRFSSAGSVTDARELARRLGLSTRTIPIEPAHAALLDMLAPHFEGLAPDVTEENLQARIRGTLLMALSNKLGPLVLATGNKSELAVGYCTLYGDMNGGLSVVGDCTKGWVRELAADVNRDREIIPEATLLKPPSAELAPGQRDEDSLPPYPVLDRILEGLVERRESPEQLVASGFDEATVRRVARLVDRNEYKRRQAAPILRVTAKAFGSGRRLPLARG